MQFFRTVLPGGAIRLADEEDRLVLLEHKDNCTRILSIPGTAELLKAVEVEAVKSGKETIVFDFPGELKVVSEDLEKEGYEISDSVKMLSVNAKELFASKGVMKSIDVSFPGNTYIPFRDLLLYQVEEMIALLRGMKIHLDPGDIDRFDDDLSCVVYDRDMKIKSLILVSAQGKEILVEMLFGVVKNNPQYIMAAMQGFAKEFLGYGLLDVYETVSMLEVNESISPLIKRLLDKEYDIDESRRVVSARKQLTDKTPENDVEFNDLAYSPLLKMQMNYPFQENINWKMQWKNNMN